MAKKKNSKSGLISTNATVAENRRAKFDYHLEEKFEAGIELVGTEVKSLRHGQCSINEAYVGPKGEEILLFNANIPEYQQAGSHLQHTPNRTRRLLLHKREINKLLGAVTREGYTIVPTKLYFNARGMAKIEIALAKGKKQHDKRETIKNRDWGREKQRLLKKDNG
ncbi:MAG: SsrA-binding protein SmpB [Rhodospirillales bacterium]|nr:SsrA-binding protein SmpB [Rhodospirillales bacterium]